MGYSFEIRSSVDLLNELSRKVDDYKNDNLSSGKAVVCSILCWHLVEWIYHEHNEQLAEFKSIKEFINYVKTTCDSLSYIQDVANGSKHRGINRYTPTVRSTEKKDGAFSSGFSTGFDISCLRMVIDGGKFVYFHEEIDKALSFLIVYLNGLTPLLINMD
ncbi:hypothetical protein [Serratia sp. CY66712]|uniref:hypothetical protein n=1 Tax=Serratia sp. CY66712 TaxID=3383659 RepID=UPI003FA1536C